MSGPIDQFDELAQLAAALCDGEIVSSQAVRLEELVRRSPEAKHLFLEYLQLHVELYGDDATGAPWTGRAVVPLSATQQARTVGSTAPRLRQLGWIVPALAASLLVALAAWLILPRIPMWRERGRPEVVAQLVRALEANWAEGSPGPAEHADLRSGQSLDLRGGFAEIVFQSGARLILEGPAAIDLKGVGGAFLHNGHVTARVPPEARGFTVGTPSATVIDLGTEFGVMVDQSGASEVHAFVGTIQVRAGGASDGAETQELVAGHGATGRRRATTE